MGMERTFCALSSQYHWKRFYNDVVQYVRSCPKCKTMGPFKKSEEELHTIPIVRPWHHLGIDLVKMPQSNQGNNYILTVVDYFSKWPEATALPDKSAQTVSSALYTIFLHMGFPAVVSSDQGREFVNGVLDTLLQKSKTEQIVSSAYHPETNGLVERFNQTLQNMLAKVCPDENDWDLYLDEVTFSYRSMNQKSTKTSPFQVMFGRNCFQNEEESQIDKHVPDDVDMEDWLKKIIDIREQINFQVKENVNQYTRI